jgi:7,8-dihydropterin-6-yl-methyl-4-(beta-D-ribofuranosyl)aminobenzene 5'-phosphate synthase
MLQTILIALSAAGVSSAGQDPIVSLTVLYDNLTAVEGTISDWGFACLVTAPGGTVLFDTGTDPEILLANLGELGVDLAKVDAVVLSHDHRDHTGALEAVLARTGRITLYVPRSFPDRYDRIADGAGVRLERVESPREILPGLHSTGELAGPIPEQALVVASPRGPVVVTGCAHPGIVAIVRRASEVAGRPPHLVLGGFHLLRTPGEEIESITGQLRELGVERVAPGHCTGEEALRALRSAFGDRAGGLGVGAVLRFAD